MNKEKMIQKINELVDSMNSEKHNNLLIVGKIDNSYIGDFKGSIIDVTKAVITVMAQNEYMKDIILQAAESYITHEDEIKALVEKHFNAESFVHKIDERGN